MCVKIIIAIDRTIYVVIIEFKQTYYSCLHASTVKKQNGVSHVVTAVACALKISRCF